MSNKSFDQVSQERHNPNQGPVEQGIKINGLEQVIELLKYADPAFRESLLKRLAGRDPQLAHNLKRVIR